MGKVLGLLVAALLAIGCGDNTRVDEDAMPADGGQDPPDASPTLAPCLDRPTDLPRPPSGQLPCDLLPPGFGS